MPPLAAAENPVTYPLGGPTLDGNAITVDAMVNPPTVIPEVIRGLVAQNEGYFAEEIFSVPGFTVQGGAIIFTETFPEDHFLPADQSIAPRAPGAEAPRLGSTRRAPKVSRPESWSGSIEVTDEARRRNNVIAVQRQFTQAANTFADRLQTRAMETLDGAVTSWGRVLPGTPWRAAIEDGVVNADPTTLPARDFAAVMARFIADKSGVRPDTLLVHQDDAFFLDVIYGEKLQPLLDRYGLRMRVSPQVTEGSPIFAKSGEVGYLGFEKPLDQEYTREGMRKTDVFTLETVPVWVADNAAAVLRLTGVDQDS